MAYPPHLPPHPLSPTAGLSGQDALLHEAQSVDRLTANMASLFTQPRPVETALGRREAQATVGGTFGITTPFPTGGLGMRVGMGMGAGVGVGMRSTNVQQQFAARMLQEGGGTWVRGGGQGVLEMEGGPQLPGNTRGLQELVFPSMPSGSGLGASTGYGNVRGRASGGISVMQAAGIDAGMGSALAVMPGTAGVRVGGMNQAPRTAPPVALLGGASIGFAGVNQALRSVPQAGSSSRSEAGTKVGNMLPCYQHNLYKVSGVIR